MNRILNFFLNLWKSMADTPAQSAERPDSNVTPPRSQLDWLASDVGEFRRLVDAYPEVWKPLADVRDPDRHARWLVVADLTLQIWTHAMAVEVLLKEDLYTSAVVIQRAIFDALVTLGYIVKHPDSQNEAVILLAYSYLRDIEHFSQQKELVDAYRKILERMPKDLVETAKARAEEHPRTWSGKTVKAMAEVAGVEGYDPAYKSMSGESHASAMGRHVRTIREGNMMNIETGRRPTPKEVEASANFARRALHTAFMTMWEVFEGPKKITIRSESPEVWLQNHRKASASAS
jgi:hypothetical protein